MKRTFRLFFYVETDTDKTTEEEKKDIQDEIVDFKGRITTINVRNELGIDVQEVTR